jgi:acyl carrier protein
MPTRDEIYTKVSATLVEALNVDEDDVTPEATLQGDLGAESIDFLDIVFRLEREFGIKIPRGELFPESIFQGDPEFVQDGKVTDKGLAELKARMPFADLSDFEKNPEVGHISDLFTVELITRYIEGKLQGSAN